MADARATQAKRYAELEDVRVNADCRGEALLAAAALDDVAEALLLQATKTLKLSARGYHRVLRLARTIADLDGAETVQPPHIAEAVTYRIVKGKAITEAPAG